VSSKPRESDKVIQIGQDAAAGPQTWRLASKAIEHVDKIKRVDAHFGQPSADIGLGLRKPFDPALFSFEIGSVFRHSPNGTGLPIFASNQFYENS
jgi:hypothetical protein